MKKKRSMPGCTQPSTSRFPRNFTPDGIRQWALERFGAPMVEKVEVYAIRLAYDDVKDGMPARYSPDGISIAEVAYAQAYAVYRSGDTDN